ncbi:hypothetical protein [Haloarchaeobius iranensis]|uniref:Uncharacterized protein n=1 Tax=Haloarchaeobius iranensis TaxID=996166 RepID=A0A1G9XPU3_9EURY|nr:hypothetical protein [Haloarchaeobius iranensis]SDM98541.1 hypothetical protein SAMN05192554_11166 [Haloarchaeobius iranensis]
MTQTDPLAGAEPLPVDSGRHLVVGPSNSGKTRTTAATLARWVADRGPDGVVVLDFAPEVERDGRLLGGRLDRFYRPPDGCWVGVLDAHAPRTDGRDGDEALTLARSNAERARTLLDAAPSPRAVFVNDATIPAQAAGDPAPVLDACTGADLAVVNAFESEELGTGDAVSRNERAALDVLGDWAEERHRLG